MLEKIAALISKNRRFVPVLSTAILAFLAYWIGSLFYSGMRDPQVFLNLFRTSPFLMISAIGSTLVILTGGIDLSVSGVVALTTVAAAAMIRTGDYNTWIVMLLMLIMGALLGAVMGYFITYLKVQPFIATLAGMWFARGMCFFISDDAIAINDSVYRILGQTKLLIPGLSDPATQTGNFITILVVLEAVVLLSAMYLAHYTRFGRTIYAIGGNEQSARLMGLPVDRTKILVYTLNGFCSALAGITLSIYVSSGHGLYAQSFELTVIAAVVIGGTMLTGGVGYVFGTLFGVLVLGIIQTLIQFNGKLSSWWTSIVVGLLMLIFIGVQSYFAAQRSRRMTAASETEDDTAKLPLHISLLRRLRRRRNVLVAASSLLVIILAVVVINGIQNRQTGSATDATPTTSRACEFQPFRQDQAVSLMQEGAILTYERNGGPTCLDELYAIYPDGSIVGDNGTETTEKTITQEELDRLLAGIANREWFTDEMYDTWHPPCGQCFTYYITVSYEGQEKTVTAVDGGTDAPANYWQVVSLINGVIPKFETP